MNKTALATAVSAAVAEEICPGIPRLRRSVLALSTDGQGEADLLIYGFIGDWFDGVSAEAVAQQLRTITATTINVYISSEGGVVSDGLAIYSALRRHPARKVGTIDGVAASIAAVIVAAFDETLMPPHAGIMIHAARTGLYGTSIDFDHQAEALRKNTAQMLEAFVSKLPKKRAEIEAIFARNKDEWFTAAEAVAFGIADRVIEDERHEHSDATAAAALLGYIRAIGNNPPAAVSTGIRKHINAAARPTAFASLNEDTQRAVVAHIEDPTMRKNFETIMAAAAAAAAGAGAPGSTATPPAQGAPAPAAASNPPAPATAAPVAQPAPAAPAPAAAVATPPDPIAAVQERNTRIRGVFAAFRQVHGIADLEADCLADPRMTVEAAQQSLLARVGAGGQPLNGGFRVEPGNDESDTRRNRIVDGMLARAGVLEGRAADEARQDNPAARMTLTALAEASLIRRGINTRDMDREQIATRVLAQQTQSDFVIILENTLHRMLQRGYTLQPFTWSRFCATGMLSDLRPHNRYHLSSFSDLREVGESGEYESGVLGDAAKETITGSRKGRILRVTPEVIINDDLGFMNSAASALGQAAGRTIEKDVYAALQLNSGFGPTMADGLPLFHTNHGNVIASGTAPTVAAFDTIRQKLASQMDPGGNDYLDIMPAVWLGPLSLGATAREVNGSEYNDESNKNQRRPNVVRNIFRDVVDSPRLPATVWYGFADPNVEPVIEVAFLDSVQTPRIEQQSNFNTDGVDWKVTHKYGVGGVGYRGAVRNAGTGG